MWLYVYPVEFIGRDAQLHIDWMKGWSSVILTYLRRLPAVGVLKLTNVSLKRLELVLNPLNLFENVKLVVDSIKVRVDFQDPVSTARLTSLPMP